MEIYFRIKEYTTDTSILIMLVDKSGSMSDITDDAIGSFNSFLEKQKQVPGDARMFVGLFDTSVQSYAIGEKLENVKPFTTETYCPGGATALLDAIGMTISTVDAKLKDYEKPRVLLAILTDGQENSSKEYSYTTIQKLLDNKKKEGWEVLFLASGIEAQAEASRLGIVGTKVASFTKTAMNYNIANETLNDYTKAYRTSTNTAAFMAQTNFATAVDTAIQTGSTTSFVEALKDAPLDLKS